jgi:TPR repeat protein
MLRPVLLAIVILSAFAVPALADPYSDGLAAYNGGNYATALSDWVPVATPSANNAGDANAQNYLGEMYLNGTGVAQDYGQAAHWFQLAAAQGNIGGQVNLGQMYMNGTGVAQDYGQAAHWFQAAAAQGNAVAQYDL